MISIENHFPRRVVIGRGTSESLPSLLRASGWGRVFLVTDAGVTVAGLAQRVCEPLMKAEMLTEAFAEVPPEPPIDAVDRIAECIARRRVDVVVALGGGSVMDAAKVAAVCAAGGRSARELVGIRKVGTRGLPTVMIPTTAGTGSEATFVAILTDPVDGNKVGVVDPALLADIAVVDPELTDGLPASITAAAGMDALVHAVEAYIARSSSPVARGLALEAARHVGSWLEIACREPSNRLARDGMATGSHLAGIAFANSSCCAVHALALPLGGRFSIPHGVITGCLAGEMMRHNGPMCARDLAELGEALGWGPLPPAGFAARLDDLADSIGLRSVLSRVRVPSRMIPTMAADAVANRRLMDPNPRLVTRPDAERIYRTVLSVAP